MWLFIGLGNPGPRYEATRHNCGFFVVDELAQRAGVNVKTRECQSLTARVRIFEQQVLLVKPQTFMNLSGTAVAQLVRKYAIEHPSRILVVSDDLALPLGRIRVRRDGSAGGHNGLKSIIASLGTQDFPRLRLGITPDHPVSDTADFVLSDFARSERDAVREMVARAADAAEVLCQDGIEKAMSKYNGS
ncbi:MAG: aminoacyl-tRNA hydrolase [Acidobacteria bacterium]|nr:aminoacyl-tRNA hydrolase [Acidobacteriota bacterium]MCW5967809.1 aminoacyl-tRNA hydrolase [Blastocatellales bacterium]